MKRLVLAGLIAVHGFAHAAIGTWAVADGSLLLLNTLWSVATVGYVAAALGILGTPTLRAWWKQLLLTASVASGLLLVMVGGGIALIGIAIDLGVFVTAADFMQIEIDADVTAAEAAGTSGVKIPVLHRIVCAAGVLVLVYVAAVTLIRPIYLRWGTTAEERAAVLPGDDVAPQAHYRLDHAITIHAPVDSVWPWLVQMGQDRGGFYSYARLERFIGDDIENADRIHPEWQHIEAGDTVFMTQPDYFGGRFGKLGWRVDRVVPGRALILENWGAFILEPVDARTTRFIVRQRGPGRRSLGSFLLGPLNVFVFEPAHFIMQRGMLRGVRDRAERHPGVL